MPNYKGNPDFSTKYRLTTDRPEACTAHLSLRIPPSLKAKLKEVDNWQEEVRNSLEKLVELKAKEK